MKTSLVPLNHSFFLPRNLMTLETHPCLHKENNNSLLHGSTELGSYWGFLQVLAASQVCVVYFLGIKHASHLVGPNMHTVTLVLLKEMKQPSLGSLAQFLSQGAGDSVSSISTSYQQKESFIPCAGSQVRFFFCPLLPPPLLFFLHCFDYPLLPQTPPFCTVHRSWSSKA